LILPFVKTLETQDKEDLKKLKQVASDICKLIEESEHTLAVKVNS
jgi:hypothetical protein